MGVNIRWCGSSLVLCSCVDASPAMDAPSLCVPQPMSLWRLPFPQTPGTAELAARMRSRRYSLLPVETGPRTRAPTDGEAGLHPKYAPTERTHNRQASQAVVSVERFQAATLTLYNRVYSPEQGT